MVSHWIPLLGVSLELTPRWGSPPAILSLLSWLALAVVPLGLVLWLYRYELHLVHRAVARGLLALRLTVVLLLLSLVLFQPSLLPAFTEKAPEHVLLVIDRTGSMDAADPERAPVDRLRLARALSLCKDLATDLQLDDWIAQYQKGNAIQWVAPEEYKDDPDSRRKLEVQRREKHDKVCERMAGVTRTETVRRLLAEDGGNLLKKLGGRFHVDVMGFAQEVWEPPAGRTNELFSWPGAAADKNDRKEPDGTTAPERAFTDLNLPLKQALEQAVQGKGALRGVILMTDGRQNRGDLPIDLAAKLGQLKAPVYPVAFGTRQPRTMLGVVNVEAPPVVLKDPQDSKTINALVKADVRVRGIAPQPLTVELKQGDLLIGRQRLLHPGVDRDYPVYFPVSLDKEGPQKLTVEIQAPPGLTDKNALKRQVDINVVKEQADVLMIDGEARWEYHYVNVALARDPLVKDVKSVVFDQPRLKKISEEELKKQNWPALKMPTEPAALADYDCIILGDPTPDQLTLPYRQRLADYVQHGGTLVMVAGKKAMPMLYPQLTAENLGNPDPLAVLLPIVKPRIVQSRAGFPVTLTDEGRDNPLLQLDEKDPGENGVPDLLPAALRRTTIWNQLPPHYWAVVGQKKPAATTLAFYPGEPEQREKEKTRAEKEAQSLIVWQSFGAGRVLFVGLDSTWRWRFKVGDKHHHRFWGQLVRWATSEKLLSGGNAQVRYGTTRTNFQPGQEIDVRVRMAKELELLPEKAPLDRPYQAVIVRVLADGKEEKVGAVQLLVRPGQPRVLEGKVRDLPVGTYRIELDVAPLADKLRDPADPAAPKSARAEFVVAAQPSEEMLDVSTDWELLQNVAKESKSNKVYTPEDANKLVDDLKRQEERGVDRTPRPLWTWWPTLVLILLLLTVEWVARKWSGLP